MIIVLKQHSGQKEIDRVENLIKTKGLDTHIVKGAGQTIIGCIGDTSRIDAKLFEVNPYPCTGALQTGKPCFPPGRHCCRCIWCEGWKRQHGLHRRTLLR